MHFEKYVVNVKDQIRLLGHCRPSQGEIWPSVTIKIDNDKTEFK